MYDSGSFTFETIKKHVTSEVDADALTKIYQQLRACQLPSGWELTGVDNASLCLRVTGIVRLPMSVVREITQNDHVRGVNVVATPGSIEVVLWNAAFFSNNVEIIKKTPLRAYKCSADMRVAFPGWCNKVEQRLIRKVLSQLHSMYKYPPKLGASIDQTSDGLRFVLKITKLTSLDTIYLVKALSGYKHVQDCMIHVPETTEDYISVHITVVRDAVIESTPKKRERDAEGDALKSKRIHTDD